MLAIACVHPQLPAAAGAAAPAGGIKPKHGLLEGIYDTIGIVDSRELSKAFKSKQLAARAASIKAVTADGVELSDGSKLTVRHRLSEDTS